VNNQMKILARGGIKPLTGLKNFTIFTSDDKKLTYGLPASVYASNFSTYRWPLVRIEDYSGNQVNYIYQVDNGGSSILISKIVYSTKVVSFEYAPRINGDIKLNYYDSSLRYQLSKRLKYINVSSTRNDTSFRETRYNLIYADQIGSNGQISSGAPQNLLKMVKKCARIINPLDNGGGQDFECLRPLQFSYNRETDKDALYTMGSLNTYGSGPLQQNKVQFCDDMSNFQINSIVDMNGDGRADIVATDSNCVFVTLNANSNQFGQRSCWTRNFTINNGGWVNGYNERDFLDLNGDRLPDLIGFINNTVYVSLNVNGTQFGSAQTWCNYFVETNNSLYKLKSFSDVNNDGFVDLVFLVASGLFVLINNNGTRFNAPYLVLNSIKAPVNQSNSLDLAFVPFLTDLNADGFVDYVSVGNAGEQTYFYGNINAPGLNTSRSTFSIVKSLIDTSLWSSNSTLRVFADVNNDGLPDLVGFNSQNVTIGLATLSVIIILNLLLRTQSNPKFKAIFKKVKK
jgi:hypothetical protein